MLNAQPDLLDHDDGFSHSLVLAKDSFYFFQFDPDATDLGLVIDAANIFVVPILPEPAQVSGAIQHLRLGINLHRDEFLFRHLGIVDVTLAQAVSRNAEFADLDRKSTRLNSSH